MKVIGIDPSMRSTGIYCDGKYILIASNPTKKLIKSQNEFLIVYQYEAESVKDKTSIEKEVAKTKNIKSILDIIKTILIKEKPAQVNIEAIAMGASGRIDELAGLNYGIRLLCLELNIPFLAIPPTTNKLKFTGNGHATKEMMIEAWKMCDKNAQKLLNIGKGLDDLADAYALSVFE